MLHLRRRRQRFLMRHAVLPTEDELLRGRRRLQLRVPLKPLLLKLQRRDAILPLAFQALLLNGLLVDRHRVPLNVRRMPERTRYTLRISLLLLRFQVLTLAPPRSLRLEVQAEMGARPQFLCPDVANLFLAEAIDILAVYREQQVPGAETVVLRRALLEPLDDGPFLSEAPDDEAGLLSELLATGVGRLEAPRLGDLVSMQRLFNATLDVFVTSLLHLSLSWLANEPQRRGVSFEALARRQAAQVECDRDAPEAVHV
mmetsp:Transcript_9703/g.21717  ORF Transcript_9703/g.21717 Transcript_9703/m.21717 type:complete len:257 (+) Transcript_9703:163-933(+)